jgi:hypothetical protein
MKMKDNIPEAGDIVKVNPLAADEWLNSGRNAAWIIKDNISSELKVLHIHRRDPRTIRVDLKETRGARGFREDWVIIYNDGVIYTSGGQIWKQPLFLLADQQMDRSISKTKTADDSLYCNCGGPTKENYVGYEKFLVCLVCKKESR